ncbi:MAG: YabP/YqfC family sporulation protein [Oscillospiraceae bacterium]|nr:YabP/YqfC family sporulation protein [Oscillospiraceae bacterium]
MKFPDEPSLLAQSGAKLELAGNREATVDGCGGVLVYTQEVVCIRYGRGVLRFTGRGLSLHSLEARSLIISGYITDIAYAARNSLLPELKQSDDKG